MPTQDSLRTTEQQIYAEIVKTRAEVKDINAKMDFILNELNSIREGLHIKSNPIKKVTPCVGHSIASDEEEEALNKRMDLIGQNGNEGLHYEE